MLRFNMMKLDKASEVAPGSQAPIPDPVTPVVEAAPPASQPASAAQPKEAGDKFDQYGYEKTPPVEPGKKVEEPVKKEEPPQPAKLEDIKDPATGYGAKPPKVDEVVVPPVEPPKVELEYELEVKDVDPGEAIQIKTFAKTYALSKEAAQALVDQRRSEVAADTAAQAEFQKAQALEIEKIKANWHQELKSDPVLGGDKFAETIVNVEKMMTDHLPLTKKILTERKSMLPSYVMKDLANLYKHLHSTNSILVQGEAVVPEKPTVEENDPLDYYK